MQYRIIGDNENILDATIERSGGTIEGSLREWMSNAAENEKLIKQLEGQLLIEDAKMKNIEEHHPFVLDMSEQDRLTVHTYTQAFATANVLTKKIAEFKDTLLAWEDQKADILAQIPAIAEALKKEPTTNSAANNITSDMFKIIKTAEDNFTYKEINNEGSTVGNTASNPVFATEAEAQAAIDALVASQTGNQPTGQDANADAAPIGAQAGNDTEQKPKSLNDAADKQFKVLKDYGEIKEGTVLQGHEIASWSQADLDARRADGTLEEVTA